MPGPIAPNCSREFPKREVISAAIRDLPEVVSVGAGPMVFAKVVRGGGIEVDRLSGLCRLSARYAVGQTIHSELKRLHVATE